MDLLQPIRPTQLPDQIKWRWTANLKFSVRSLYLFLTDSGMMDPLSQHIWKLNIPGKIKIFLWLLLRKRIPTADRLHKQGWLTNQLCYFCAVNMESYDHLMCSCVFVRFILFSVDGLVDLIEPSKDVRDLWSKLINLSNANERFFPSPFFLPSGG